MRAVSWQKKIGQYNLEKSEKDLFQRIYNDKVISYKSPKFIVSKDVFHDIRSMKLWVCHTNFHLLDNEVLQIANLMGVESITHISPYRLEVCIAELFSDIEVRNRISDYLCKVPVVTKKQTVSDMRINLLKDDLSKNFRYWAILIDKDNAITQIHADTESSFYEKMNEVNLNNNYSQIIKCDK